MGIKYLNLDESNVINVINLNKSEFILKQIDPRLISEEVCLAAVKANGLAIRHAPENFITQKVALAAIRQDRRAFFEIPIFTEDDMYDFIIESFEAFFSHYKDPKFLHKLFSE